MGVIKKYSAVIEWIIAIFLVYICVNYSIFSYGNLSPLKEHEKAEKSLYYGPSKIIKTIDLGNEKFYLCRYKDWFSMDSVKKGMFFWHTSDIAMGVPIDYSKQVSYTHSGSGINDNEIRYEFFGYVNDPKLTTISLTEKDGKNIANYNLDENRMFFITCNDNSKDSKIANLKGTDKEGKIIYEERVLGF